MGNAPAVTAAAPWDPAQYGRFAAERARPFHDLVGAVRNTDPVDVVDLGCGPGDLTAELARRWPRARVVGIDSSPEMIAAASHLARSGRLEFSTGSIELWGPEPASVDVVVSNAALQWVPGHLDLLPHWLAALRPGGTLAFAVPATHSGPVAGAVREIVGSARWARRLEPVLRGESASWSASPVRSAAEYLDALASLGAAVDVWETTYLHVLPGDDPVLDWYSSTGLRPYLGALDPAAAQLLRTEIRDRLRTLHPRQPYGTVLPLRRIFVVARTATEPRRTRLPRSAGTPSGTPAPLRP
jgi:trans-aconitate 2-methyltransferase